MNESVAARIRTIANELGYSPHRAAKALRLNHDPVEIAVILPRTSSDFFSQIERGVADGAGAFEDMGIHTHVRWFDPSREDAFIRTLEEAVADGCAGIALTGPQTPGAVASVRTAVESGLPVVTTNSDLPSSGRMAFVGQDLYQSGVVAAELMGKMTRRAIRPARLIALTGNLTFQAHRDRIDGFAAGIGRWMDGTTVEVVEGQDRYDGTLSALEAIDPEGVVGAYAATGSIRALLEVRERWPEPKSVRVITNDDLPIVREGLLDGRIDFTILQDASAQGSEPVRLLAEHLLSGTRPANEWVRTPVIIAGATLLEVPPPEA